MSRLIWKKYYRRNCLTGEVTERTFPVDFSERMVLTFFSGNEDYVFQEQVYSYCFVLMKDAIEVEE